jgi:thioesterase domain-containing protein/ketosteroid isomerase-like protein
VSRPNFLSPLQSAGTKRPFFCVHPIGGDSLCYTPLAKAIDPERPFFGIQSPMLENPEAGLASIEEMAARYVDAIRSVQAEGPYLIGGWSFGGTIAVEMARQLRRSGQAVGQLVLLDAIASPSGWLTLLHRKEPRWAAALAILPSSFSRPAREALRKPGKDGLLVLSELFALASQNLTVSAHHLALWQRHQPAEVDVPTLHFVPEKRAFSGVPFLSTDSGKLPIRSMSTLRVLGDHFSMLSSEFAQALGARMKDALDRADSVAPVSGDVGTKADAEASVRGFLDRYVNWMRKRDGAALCGIYADGCVNVTSGESIMFEPASMQQHYSRKIPGLLDARIHVHEWHVIVSSGGKTACAIGRLDSDQTFIQGQRRVSYRGVRVSLVLERQADSWCVLHSHYSLPVGGQLETLA